MSRESRPLIVLYEPDRLVRSFYPLAQTRPVCHLIYGTTTIGERIAVAIGLRPDCVLCHPDLETMEPLPAHRDGAPCGSPGGTPEKENRSRGLFRMEGGNLQRNGLFLSSGFLPERGALDLPFAEERGICLYDDGHELVGYYLPAHRGRLKVDDLRDPSEDRLVSLTSLKFDRIEVKGKRISFLWDLVLSNAEAIRGDLKGIVPEGSVKIDGEVDPGAVIVDTHGVVVSGGAKVEAFALLDSTNGPIFVDRDAVVKSHSAIEGPAYIGEGSHIAGARIRGGCTFGVQCRVGGEIEQSILQGYVNKYHDGFLGHSYVGSWVNFGAGSTNSDLKNNYKPVRVTLQGETVDTMRTKIGAFLGDHVKLGIGSLMNTGFVCGVGANLFGGRGVLPKAIPSFVWGDGRDMEPYRFEEFEKTARTVMRRRDIAMSDRYLRLLRKVYEMTAGERDAFLARSTG